MRLLPRLIVLTALLLGAPSVHGQAASTPAAPTPAAPGLADVLLGAPVTTEAAVKADFRYTVTPETRGKAQADYLASLAATNADAAKRLGEQLARNDVGALFGRMVQPFGLKPGDLADTFTAYVFLNWSIVHGDTRSRPDDAARLGAIRLQVGNLLATNPQLAEPAARARMGAELELLFVLLQSSWQAAAQQNTLGPFAQSVAQSFSQQMGLDLRAVTLTTRGLAKKQ